MPERREIVIVGGGPAGIAAACRAAEAGARVTVIDANPEPGGQIWRRERVRPSTAAARLWFERFAAAGVRWIGPAHVVAETGTGRLLIERDEAAETVHYDRLILATGARERFLPFPGWTLPGVFGAGGLQALVKSGLPVVGRRIVVAGSGPLLMPVAALLKRKGARVLLIAEQASMRQMGPFVTAVAHDPARLMQAVRYRLAIGTVPYRTASWPVRAIGRDRLEAVEMRVGSVHQTIACDWLACGFHLVPQTELAQLFGCRLEAGCVAVDEFQRTSRGPIYAAGEPTGIGGLDRALVEGQIAGLAAAGREDEAHTLFRARARWDDFVDALQRAFAPRPEVLALADGETIVCRCEDVQMGALERCGSWREAKLLTRCGMGPCQGRVCGTVLTEIRGWPITSIRPPVLPARVGSFVRPVGEEENQNSGTMTRE